MKTWPKTFIFETVEKFNQKKFSYKEINFRPKYFFRGTKIIFGTKGLYSANYILTS